MRILLADDQKEVCLALKIILEHEPGLTVIGEASEPVSLITQVMDRIPDLILLDWELTGFKTYEVISALKVVCPGLKIVALSSRPEASKAALESGADAFVSKGDNPEMLLDTLHRLDNI